MRRSGSKPWRSTFLPPRSVNWTGRAENVDRQGASAVTVNPAAPFTTRA